MPKPKLLDQVSDAIRVNNVRGQGPPGFPRMQLPDFLHEAIKNGSMRLRNRSSMI